MENRMIELSDIEKEVDGYLQKAAFYLQTYRGIDALAVLEPALAIVNSKDVRPQVKAAVYRDLGQAHIQVGHFEDGLRFFIQSYETLEDGNDKAAAAEMIAGYFLREGKLVEAEEYARKSQETATDPELLAGPYHILGEVAARKGYLPEAIELMNKAAELAEQSHCITDLAMIIMDLSAVFLKMGMKETALSEICRAERYVKECHNLDLYTRCAIRRARILLIMGKDEEAKALIMALDEQEC